MRGPAKTFSQNPNLTVPSIMYRYYTAVLSYSLAGGFLIGIYPLFLHSRGLAQFEINSLLATFYIVTFLLDIPTGAFADIQGRRRAFIIGCAFRCAALTIYFYSRSFTFFLIAETIDGIGTSFVNGALDAWAIDALDKAGFRGSKDRVISHAYQFSTLGLMISPILGAAIATRDLSFPWLLGAGGFFLSGLIGAVLRERYVRYSKLSIHPREISDRIYNAARRGFAIRQIRYLCIAEGIVLAALTPYGLEWPMLFRHTFGTEVWAIGWMVALFSLSRMIGAELSPRMLNIGSHRVGYLSGLMAAAAVILFVAGAITINLALTLGLLILLNVCIGAKEPLALAWINELFLPDDRATMLSFRSMCATVGASAGLLTGGYVADLWGISIQWMAGGILLGVSAACYVRAGTRYA